MLLPRNFCVILRKLSIWHYKLFLKAELHSNIVLLLLRNLCSFQLNLYKDDTLENENSLNNKIKYDLTNGIQEESFINVFTFLMYL